MKYQELQIQNLSTETLQYLIASATQELVSRTQKIRVVEPPTNRESIDVVAPNSSDVRFVQAILKRVLNRALIRAAEKDRYAEIAKMHEPWFEFKEYPKSMRSRTADAFAEYGKI